MKSKLTNDQKREWAQLLYTKDRLSQKEIAAKVGSSEKTISGWKDRYNWDDLRKSLLITKEEQLRRFYNQLDFLNKAIEERESKVATSKESDTIVKLTAAIKNLETETSIASVIDVAQQVINFVRSEDLEKAKEFTGYFDAFIQQKLAGK